MLFLDGRGLDGSHLTVVGRLEDMSCAAKKREVAF